MKKISLYKLAYSLFRIPRSLAGEGNRKTLKILSKFTNDKIEIKGFKSGKKFNGWKIPKEWEVLKATIKDSKGKKIIDFERNNLELVSYSQSFKGKLNLKQLKEKIFTLKKLPRAIPYVTAYYKKNFWSVCMSFNQFKKLKKGNYEVDIKTKKTNGFLNYGEHLVKGKSKKEIIFMSYICHPQMANNELSGPVVLAGLINDISKKFKKTYFSYRFIFLPETIGSIAYLNHHHRVLHKNFMAGYVVTCVGTTSQFKLIPSLNPMSISNKMAIQTLDKIYKKEGWKKMSFLDRGSDERQWCFPGTNLQVSSIVTSKYNNYKEYHTSLDNMNFINDKALKRSKDFYFELIRNFENSDFYKIDSIGEPKLDKYGIYPKISTTKSRSIVKNLMNILTYCDGSNNLKQISKICNLSLKKTSLIISILLKKKIIKKI